MKEQIARLVDYIYESGWTINFNSRRNEADHFSKCININYQTHGKKLYWTLLHECGHMIIRSNPATFMCRYPGITAALVSEKAAGYTNYRVDTVREEFNAWDEGERLADQLELELDKKAYRKFGNTCLLSYIKWCTKNK